MAVRFLARDLLSVDHVLTDAQLARLGLSGEDFPGLTLTVRPMNDCLREEDVTFRALKEETLARHLPRLPHYAATAAVRHLVGGDVWEIDHKGAELAPDAVWEHGGQKIAVEYDAGYRPATVRRKMEAFRDEYDRIIWATPSAVRSARMAARYPQAQVLTVDYWTPPRTAGHDQSAPDSPVS